MKNEKIGANRILCKMKDLFSVIILTYNNTQFLYECIDSILVQTYPNIELIIADDGSECFDAESVEQYCFNHRSDNITLVNVYRNEENLGTVRNANRALEASNGTFIKIIGGDDQLGDEESLMNAASALMESPDGIVAGNVIKCDPNMNFIEIHNKLEKKLNHMGCKESFARLCIHNDLLPAGIFINRKFVERFCPYDESYRLLEDWPMWLKVYREGARIHYVPFTATKYRANVGLGTSVNEHYMADKRRVMEEIIKPAKKEIGFVNYLKARISFMLINNLFIRRMYGVLFRKGKK